MPFLWYVRFFGVLVQKLRAMMIDEHVCNSCEGQGTILDSKASWQITNECDIILPVMVA